MDVYTAENKEFHRNNYDKVKSHEWVKSVTDEQIQFVRDEYNKGELTRQEVFELSGITNINTFADIWNNNTFKNIVSTYPNNRIKGMHKNRNQDGTKNALSKYTEEEIMDIRRMYRNGIKVPEIYKKYHNHSAISTLYRIVNYESYKNVKEIDYD